MTSVPPNATPEASTPAASPKRRSRLGLTLPVTLLVFICIGWSVFWLVSAHLTEQTLEGWMQREASIGRIWECPERSVGGYPFNIVVTCGNPTFRGQLADRRAEGAVKSIRALAQVYQPSVVLAELEGPLTIRTQDGGPALDASWSHLRASLHGAPDGLVRVSLVIEDPKVSVSQGELSLFGQASHVETHLRRSPTRPAAENAYDFAFELRDALIPALDGLLRSDAAMTASGEGVLTHVFFDEGGTPADRMEHWRAAGGRLELTRASASKGSARLDAKGLLMLDPLHRPQGRVDARMSGLAPVLAQFGVPVSVLAIDNLLGGLLGGGKRAKDPGAPKDQIDLPLSFDNGRLRVGPVLLPVSVAPLY